MAEADGIEVAGAAARPFTCVATDITAHPTATTVSPANLASHSTRPFLSDHRIVGLGVSLT
ncbi:hypothetical protein, partial [Streptomyces nogalater]